MLAALLAAALSAAPPTPVDPADAVRAADLAMARAVEARDGAAFAACLDPDAVFVGEGGLLRGRDEVARGWRPFLEPDGPRLSWTPERAVVAASGDLAFTTGSFAWEAEVRPGEKARRTGAYVTVWRRGPGGAWRARLDAALEPAERLGAGLVRRGVAAFVSRAGDLSAEAGTWARGAERGGFVVVTRRAASGAPERIDAAVAFRPAERP